MPAANQVCQSFDTDLHKVNKCIKLCENHFYERDIIRRNKRNFLREGAIPREFVVLKTKNTKSHNFDHSKLNYIAIQKDYENSQKEFCEIILGKIPQTNINQQDISGRNKKNDILNILALIFEVQILFHNY